MVIDDIVTETVVESRKSKTGYEYYVLIVNLDGGSKIETIIDKAYGELCKVLLAPTK